ncbi:MAG: SDR family NAD(P)-dependent oxidoreductase, partial [Planctomycetota bacterium]
MRWKPEGAVAVVTGASSGIGRCMCQLLIERQCHVVASARRGARLDDLASLANQSQVVAVQGDIVQAETRQRMLDAAVELGNGRLDLLVNNAGIGAIGPFAEATADRLRQIMEVNFFAPAELIRASLPALRLGRAPVICNIGSVLGHR